jgi:hypothetical protein
MPTTQQSTSIMPTTAQSTIPYATGGNSGTNLIYAAIIIIAIIVVVAAAVYTKTRK